MHSYTFSEAKQNFSAVLNQAKKEGRVQISGPDGQPFMLTPVNSEKSPLDIPGIDLNLTGEEIVDYVRASRERY
ncbi:MAG: hypothetical protein NTV43_10675 [Methylococcales bacterium]|nr:hypothetical protein [Methylococcales bacterium]